MRFKSCSAVVAVCLLIAPCMVSSQILQQMEITDIGPGESMGYVPRGTDEAILIVYSAIPQLQFESSNKLISVDNKHSGIWILHLGPGTNLIKVEADSYETLQQRFVINAKQVKEVRVVPLGAKIDLAETGTLELSLAPGPVVVFLNGEQISSVTVKQAGVLPLKQSAGKHVVKLVRSGNQVYEKEFEVTVGETIVDTVRFVMVGDQLSQTANRPGVLFVKTDPAAATVYVDGVEVGITDPNLTIQEIAPGEHEIRLEKPFYLPLTKAFIVAPDDVVTLDDKLIPNFGQVTISSVPAQAEVVFDGQPSGRTPFVLGQVSVGSHRVVLRKTPFHDVELNLSIVAGARVDTTLDLPPAFGGLAISTIPAKAEVYIDQQLVGLSPITLDTVISGTHVFRLVKDLYTTVERTVEVTDGQQVTIDHPLDQNYGTLKITSVPAGVQARLNHMTAPLGPTPIVYNIAPGTYQVEMNHELYESYSTMATVSIGQATEVTATLARKTGVTKIFSDPAEAEIYIDGKLVGTTPEVVKDHPTGTYQIELRMKGYLAQSKSVTVVDGSDQSVQFKLDRGCAPGTGIIDFDQIPAGTQIKHNGSVLGSAPMKYVELDAGPHTFEFKKKKCEGSGRLSVMLKDQQTFRPEYKPRAKSRGKAAFRSLIIPGLGQYYSEQGKKGTVFLIAELASLGWLGLSYTNYNTKKDEYQAAIDTYARTFAPTEEKAAWAQIESTYADYTSANDRLSTAFMIPVVVHAVSFLDALIFGGGSNDATAGEGGQLSLRTVPDGRDGFRVNVSRSF